MKKTLTLTVLALVTTARVALAGEPTAFDLIKEANEHVGKDAKDKVIQIRSEKSIGSLTPNVWYVVFHDPDASFKATEVKFGGGKKMKVSRPARIADKITNDDKKLDRDKIKIDSDKAIEIASSEPILKPVTLKASKLTLKKHEDTVVWRVQLWAAKLKNPNDNTEIGEVLVSAEDGKIVKSSLEIENVD